MTQQAYEADVATWIREQRSALGLSQAWLARAVGTSVATISRWEKGQRRVGLYAHKRLKFLFKQQRELQAARSAMAVEKAMATL
jgi:DNA-binding transcriptional regulator YiaG